MKMRQLNDGGATHDEDVMRLRCVGHVFSHFKTVTTRRYNITIIITTSILVICTEVNIAEIT